MLAKGGRFAGNALKWLFSNYDEVSKSQKAMSALEIAGRLGPDVLFSGMSMAATPGDFGDKAIVGATQLLGGSLGGLAAGKLSRNPAVSGLLDLGGSVAGDMASMPVADALMRGKDKISGGKGQTPYERLSDEQQQQLAQQIEQQVLQAYGLVPGTRDQYLGA
jgi:hypothetical protein